MNRDIFYLSIAKTISLNSKCLSRKIGAVVVNPQTNSVISTGYNGPPVGTPHCNETDRAKTILASMEDSYKYGNVSAPYEKMVPKLIKENPNVCPRKYLGFESGKGLEFCVAGHAERNALINAAKNGIATFGCTLYCYCGHPCKDCCIEIINAGIKRVVCFKQDKTYDHMSVVLLKQSGVIVDTTVPSKMLVRGGLE